jgi:PAS domain S-box-containing protein
VPEGPSRLEPPDGAGPAPAAAARPSASSPEPRARQGTARSLLRRVVLLVALALTPLVAFLAWNEHRTATAIQSHRLAEARAAVRRAVIEQERIFDAARQMLTALSALQSVRTLDGERCSRSFAGVAREVAGNSLIWVAHAEDGQVFCASRPEPVGTSVADRWSFQSAVAAGGFVTSGQVIGRVTSKPVIQIARRAPAEQSAGVVVAAGLETDRLAAALAAAPLPEGAALLVADRNGVVIASLPDTSLAGQTLPEPLARLRTSVPSSGTAEAAWAGTSRLTAFETTPASTGGGLFVAVGLDQHATHARMLAELATSGPLLALALALSFGLTLLFAAGRLEPSLARLLGAAESWRRGEFGVRAGIPPQAAFGQIGRAFDEMAAAVEAREIRLRALFHDSPAPSLVLLADSLIIQDGNAAAAELLGRPVIDLLGRSLASFEDPPPAGRPRRRPPSLAPGQGDRLTLQIRTAAGERRDLLVARRCVLLGGQRLLFCIALDISERQAAARALAEGAAHFRGLADAVPGIVFTADAEGRTSWVSEAWRRFTGLEGVRALAGIWLDTVHPDDQAAAAAAWAACLADRRPYESRFRLRRADGAWRWHLARAMAVNDADGRFHHWVGVVIEVHDLTDARASLAESETRLRVAEERLRLALDGTEEGPWDWNVATGDIWFSDRWLEMHGYARDEIPPDISAWTSLLHPEDGARVADVLDAHLAGRTPAYACEYRLRKGNGDWQWILCRGKVVARDAEGRALRMVGTHQDVTRRKLAEEALAESEARLRSLVEGVEDHAIVMLDCHGRVASWNGGAERITGWPPAAALHQPFEQVFAARAGGPGDAATLLADARQAGLARHAGRFRRHDGTPFEAEATVTLLQDADGGCRGFAVVARDITARREAEGRLLQLQAEAMRSCRIGAMGALAAGLAHELNQPLGAISNYAMAARMAVRRAAGGDPQAALRAEQGLDRIAAQALRAGDIIRRLRASLGSAEGEPATIPVRDLVERTAQDALALLHVDTGGALAFALQTEVAPDTAELFGEAGQIQLVLTNLLRNAAEAVQHAPERRVTLGARRAAGEPGVELYVADTGPGLAPGALTRLFEPFQSRKPAGMGIGLAICRTIVEAHGGRIWAEAGEGGTVFRLVIPDAEATLG